MKDEDLHLMTVQLTIPTMACSACVNNITKAIQEVDATATIQADTKSKLVSIETNADKRVIKEAIAAAGYSSN